MNSILVFISAIFIAFCNAEMSANIAESFKKFEIEPDTVPVSPTKLVTVDYPSGVSVELGNELTPTQVKDKPTLNWEAEKGAFYTLLMVDPDAPSRATPKFREVRHWAVVNIPGCSVAEGNTIVEYIGSGPPEGTGLHRYIFLVYKQPNGKIQYDETYTSNRSRENRFSTSAATFSKKYNLGDPEFGNFYQAQYDDYVPILHAQFSGA